MLYPKQFILAVIILLVSLTLPGGMMAQDDTADARTGLRPDAPAYGVRGPHAVGTRSFIIDGDTALDITVWYPASDTDGEESTTSYPYAIKMDAPPGAAATVAGQATHDAAYDLSAAPYPLVILSPGFIIGSTSYAWLGEHLASYGFVVITPEHQEQFDETMSDFWQAMITRPQDVQHVLAFADEQVQAGGALDGLVDTDTVAVVGHSLGGYTALAAAGAQLDTNNLASTCDDAREAGDPNAWLCDLVMPFEAEMAELAGFDTIPEGLWPAQADPRIDAIVPMAGDAYMFGQAGLAEISIPVMAIGGTADTGTPYAWGTQPTYEHVSSQTKARVSLENAEHMVFASSCEALPWFAEIGFYSFCSDPVWDSDRAHDLINHFTTAFLLSELSADSQAAAALAPDAAQFPGVSYEAQGY